MPDTLDIAIALLTVVGVVALLFGFAGRKHDA
jgi:hypothetical protein